MELRLFYIKPLTYWSKKGNYVIVRIFWQIQQQVIIWISAKFLIHYVIRPFEILGGKFATLNSLTPGRCGCDFKC